MNHESTKTHTAGCLSEHIGGSLPAFPSIVTTDERFAWQPQWAPRAHPFLFHLPPKDDFEYMEIRILVNSLASSYGRVNKNPLNRQGNCISSNRLSDWARIFSKIQSSLSPDEV
jgi:hypothetical protein